MSISTHQCPNCGGSLEFNPELQQCKCEFCLSKFSIQELEDKNQNNESQEPEIVFNEFDGDLSEETNSYSCPSCGAGVITDKVTSATFCCYCHNPVILNSQLQNEFKPSKIIPFKLNKEKAINTLKQWCSKKKFLPSDFLSKTQLEKLTGIYVPYWLTDCDISAALNAQATKVSTWSDSKHIYTKTDKYAVSRQGTMLFEKIPHDASKKADDSVMESIEPFDYKDLKDFSMSYLSGFLAEKYDVTKEEITPIIKQRVSSVANSALSNTINGYTSVTAGGINVNYKKVQCDYALLPVWIATYKYNGNSYLYAINGQSGKMFGILPVSRKKLAILFGAVAVCAAALIIGGGMLLL